MKQFPKELPRCAILDNEQVEIVKRGSFEDTVIVKTKDGKQIEVYLNRLIFNK